MRINMTRLAGAAAVVAVASVGLISASASALPPGSPSAGTPTLAPASGTQASTFTLAPPAGAACAGDSASGGYRWQTFMVPTSVDAGTLTYNATGPVAPAGVTFAQPLFSAGSPVVNKTTAVTSGVLSPIPTYSFPAGLSVPAGTYNIGYACTLSGVTDRFWQAPITVTGGGATFNFAFGAVPSAAVLASPLSKDNGTLSGSFTLAAAVPAITSLTVTATPTVGAPITLALALNATTFTITGLTNGTAYAVKVTATNATGSTDSNIVNGTPNPAPFAAPGLIANAVTGGADFVISAPVGETTPHTGYTLEVATDAAFTAPIVGSPFTVAAAATTFSVTGQTPGTVLFARITATYPAPFSGLTSSVQSFAPQSSSLITQDISVTRPLGGLVLTQRCGVFGALDFEPSTNAFPAYAGALQIGTVADAAAPTLLTGGTAPTTNGGVADPVFGQYPYPVDANQVPNPTYPTHCGLNLGVSQLITSGTEAGKYFRVEGRLNEVTVVDTRNVDAGWTLQGSMSDFVSGSNTFSGNYLGWTPKASFDSGPTLEGYDMVTTAGGVTQPAFTTGMRQGPKTLGSAAVGKGLGIAAFDAHLRLLIPVTADNGTYTATLTLSAV